MVTLATRLSKIEEPQTIKMAKLSRELKAQGKDIIDLSLGEPDFATPTHIQIAAVQAMKDGFTKYPPVAGFPDVKNAIIEKFSRDNQLQYTPEEIMISTGAKQCISNIMACVINDGDEVVIPSPYWVTYGDLVKLNGGNVIEVKATIEDNFKITPQQLEAAITPKTKAFIFSSPCNPTGSVYSKTELEELAKVFLKNPGILVISDEIYEHINFAGTHFSIAKIEGMKEKTVVVNGLSKAFAMTGWRLGYIAGPAYIIKACETMQSQTTSGANSITQKSTIAALTGTTVPAQEMVQAFKERRDFIVAALREIKGVKANNPDGAFYVFPDISSFFGKSHGSHLIHNALDLCMYLLHEANVSCVTGDAFGDGNCIRISYATSMGNLQSAILRVKKALELLK
jgi:aspartate aminotransferase